jgi:hypothetical protein
MPTSENVMNAYLQEMSAQRGLLADRAVNLAGQLAEALARIAELEAQNELLRGAPRVVK